MANAYPFGNNDVGLHKELECPVCLDTLKKPKLLGCTHTFCLECLETLVKEENDVKKIICPTCREVTKVLIC